MRIAIIHYAYIPVIGGVEFVVAQHADLFTRHGHQVHVLCGRGESRSDDVTCTVIPELLPTPGPTLTDPENDPAAPGFESRKSHLKATLHAALEDFDVIFVHNVMTMHFNLAATAALWELAEENPSGSRWVNWIHDLAALDSEYPVASSATAADSYPASLLSKAHPGMTPVAISENRRRQFAKLTGTHSDDCPVIANGIEFPSLLKLTKNVRRITRIFAILYHDIVLIHPTRIVKRKNIEFGIRVLAALKAMGKSCLYLVTGAPDPHSGSAHAYGEKLRELVGELGVEAEFHFVTEHFTVSDRDLISLYSLSDLLFLPSRHEGFGIPILEAGLFRLPVFCTGIEPMNTVLENNAHFFDLSESAEAVAGRIVAALESSPGYKARKEVMHRYSWDVLYKKEIAPRFLNSP